MFPTFISSKLYFKTFILLFVFISHVLAVSPPPQQHTTNITLNEQTNTTTPIPSKTTASTTTPPTTEKTSTPTTTIKATTTTTIKTTAKTTPIYKKSPQQQQQHYPPKNNQQRKKILHRINYEEPTNYQSSYERHPYERAYPPKYNSRGYYGSGEKEYGGDYKEVPQYKEYPSHAEYNNEGNYEQYQNGYEKEYYPAEEKKPYAPEGNYNYEKESEEYNNYDEYNKQQSYSGTSPWAFDQNKRHSYDSHYCSVHGSFSLALATTYGNEYSSNYGKSEEGKEYDQSYSPTPQPRYHTRQFCRFTAANSQKACQICCRIVARSANTSPDDIISAIFKFDPAYPSANGAGIGGDYEETSYTSTSLFQCVCCAPK
uniref:Uncharacterized protein n=1 Tax=Meloidogyne enterolobii TaxID=390850 RepID=A0A6V7U7R2_MELEN|nr:unnamed protein product [Meloidogyne enterolobii]